MRTLAIFRMFKSNDKSDPRFNVENYNYSTSQAYTANPRMHQ